MVWECRESVNEGERMPRVNPGEIVTVTKKDGTVISGTVLERVIGGDYRNIPGAKLKTPDGVVRELFCPATVESIAVTFPEVKLDFTVDVQAVQQEPSSFYVVEFFIDQRDADDIRVSSERRAGKPSAEELARLSIMSNKYRNLDVYDGDWYNVRMIRNALASYLHGDFYDACCRFKIREIRVWGYDADRGAFVTYMLPTLEEMNVIPEIGLTLDQAYVSLFRDFNTRG